MSAFTLPPPPERLSSPLTLPVPTRRPRGNAVPLGHPMPGSHRQGPAQPPILQRSPAPVSPGPATPPAASAPPTAAERPVPVAPGAGPRRTLPASRQRREGASRTHRVTPPAAAATSAATAKAKEKAKTNSRATSTPHTASTTAPALRRAPWA